MRKYFMICGIAAVGLSLAVFAWAHRYPQLRTAQDLSLAILDLRESSRQVPQFDKFELEFELNRQFDNTYDPDQIDVMIRLTAPDGSILSHPGFYDECYRLSLDHGKEVPRKNGNARWRVRFTPSIPGRYAWTLIARTGEETANRFGSFECIPSTARGFVQIVDKDPRYFEFSNKSFFYPIGHVCRSPVDRRWARFTENGAKLAQFYIDRGVFCYDDWFPRMAENGENFTSIWMCPWWCGLEWSRELPGFDGIGRYNQVNAARLDRIIEAAERHGIFLALFTSNHGALSSVTDGEWHHSPFNKKYRGGYLEYASDFFTSEPALKAHRNRIRYTIARWGYSTSIAIWSISTETDWLEAYYGQRSLRSHERGEFQGFAPAAFKIADRQDLVRQWLIDMALFFKHTDAHPHIVSTQFSHPETGKKVWQNDKMEVILNSAYTHVAENENWQGEYYVDSKGVADALFVFGKRFEAFVNRPVLVAEWGGATEENSIPHLKAELHTGIWTSFMTTNAGATGFWWWNVVDTENLYPHYRALARFAEGEDRRAKSFQSARARVLYAFPSRIGGESKEPLVVESSRELAVVLFNPNTFFAYIFSREINETSRSRPADSFYDASFGQTEAAYLELPRQLTPGVYRVEFWDTFKGEIVERREIKLLDGARKLPLISHNVDLAVKLRLSAP